MGFGGIGIWQLLIVLVIVLLLFGTKRLKNIGGDLGGAVRGFKSAMKDGAAGKQEDKNLEKDEGQIIEGQAHQEKDKV